MSVVSHFDLAVDKHFTPVQRKLSSFSVSTLPPKLSIESACSGHGFNGVPNDALGGRKTKSLFFSQPWSSTVGTEIKVSPGGGSPLVSEVPPLRLKYPSPEVYIYIYI